ncbi:MAG: hypothetical protein LBI84_03285 [Propionibacteriaceae bacterium]|jgi:hypothetical protein|nr:hypothetical protein [Propionibacteriaceae bacterium]
MKFKETHPGKNGKPNTSLADLGSLAPDLDPAWAEDFILALRARGVAGAQIGEALAEADDHVKASGETAAEAFGAPTAYADSLDLPADPGNSPGAIMAAVTPVLVQLVGLNLALAAVPALRDGRPAHLPLGAIASLALITGLVLVLAGAFKPILEALLIRPVLGTVAMALAMAICLSPTLLWSEPTLEFPALPALIAGLVIVPAGSVWIIRTLTDDPITPPSHPGAAAVKTAQRRRSQTALALLVPFFLVALALFNWFFAP